MAKKIVPISKEVILGEQKFSFQPTHVDSRGKLFMFLAESEKGSVLVYIDDEGDVWTDSVGDLAPVSLSEVLGSVTMHGFDLENMEED